MAKNLLVPSLCELASRIGGKGERVKEGRRDVSCVAKETVDSPTCTDHCLGKSRPFGADTGA
jgi:hypothetical protein